MVNISIYEDDKKENQTSTTPGDFNEAQILEAGRRYMDRCLELFSSSFFASFSGFFISESSTFSS